MANLILVTRKNRTPRAGPAKFGAAAFSLGALLDPGLSHGVRRMDAGAIPALGRNIWPQHRRVRDCGTRQSFASRTGLSDLLGCAEVVRRHR